MNTKKVLKIFGEISISLLFHVIPRYSTLFLKNSRFRTNFNKKRYKIRKNIASPHDLFRIRMPRTKLICFLSKTLKRQKRSERMVRTSGVTKSYSTLRKTHANKSCKWTFDIEGGGNNTQQTKELLLNCWNVWILRCSVVVRQNHVVL